MEFCGTAQLLSPSLGHSFSSQHRVATQSPADPTSSSSLSSSCSSCSSTPRPDISSWSLKSKTLSSLSKTLAFSFSSGLLFHFSSTDNGPGNSGPVDGGGGGGGGDWGWNRNGGGDGGNFWFRLFSPSAIAGEEEFQSPEWDTHGLPANIVVQLNKLSGFKKYKISEILLFDRRRSTTVGTEDSLFKTVSLRPGDICTKAHLLKEIETLATCGMFEKVNMEGKTKADGTLGITISFTESTWRSADSFRCANVGHLPRFKPVEMDPDMTDKEKLNYLRNEMKDYKRRIERARPCLLPLPVQREVTQMLWKHGKISARLLLRIFDLVQKWYDDEGYVCAQVVNWGHLTTKELAFEVVEGDITQLVVQFEDKLGNICEGNTHLGVIMRELPKQLRQGHVYNRGAAKQAFRNLKSLALFSNIEPKARADKKNKGGVIVEIKLKELEQPTAKASTEWTINFGHQGRPTLEYSGTAFFKHRNLNGLNRSICGSVTNNMDDFFFTLDYVHPYLDGVYNPRNRTFCASCFNSRKLSPVFTGGYTVYKVPPIWVDRIGVKANITESFTRQSKFTCGLVMEKITMRDGNMHISANGQRQLPSGDLTVYGPPTTLSGTGIDRMAFAQANITRDNTKFVNGAVVGDKNVFQVDQGLGIGSKFPFFNRHQLTMTRFIQLKQVEEGASKPPPPVLVLHGHYGGCVGDLPSYDAFTLGGPYSVRGYNMGELGACRNILEHFLGSSKDVKGNPTEFYWRAGQGSSYGIGVKLGSVRAEYTVTHNEGTGAFSFRFGERF